MERNKICCMDVLDGLKLIPDGTIQTVITSPPYWNLRDYGVPGQLGLEPTPEMYVRNMVEIFREIKRVLRPNGTVWLNLGDSYAANRGYQVPDNKHVDVGNNRGMRAKVIGLKPKDLIGLPWRVALALQADGWWLRMDIVWSKPNPMPSSVTDRPGTSHEYIFLLAKSSRYFYDSVAVREKGVYPAGTKGGKGSQSRKRSGANSRPEEYATYSGTRNKRSVWSSTAGGADWDFCEACQTIFIGKDRNRIEKIKELQEDGKTKTIKKCPCGVTDRWAGHFAAYPGKLIEPCILAGTSPYACCTCGAPWKRVVEKKRISRPELSPEDPRYRPGKYISPYKDINGTGDSHVTETRTIGWAPTCKCNKELQLDQILQFQAGKVPVGLGRCIILDPFIGTGTTAMKAVEHGRDYLGIEISELYTTIATLRVERAVEDAARKKKQGEQTKLFEGGC